MMTEGPEPNGYELQRSIDKVDKSLTSGLADIKIILATLVSRDLFDAEQRRRDELSLIQEKRIVDLEDAIKEHEKGHEEAKWHYWANIVMPLLCLFGSVGIHFMK